jgi:hypothetical protein
MTELSPAAQAVLTEITQQEYSLDPADIPIKAVRMAYIAAAALEAAADQVVPEVDLHVSVATDLLPKDIGAAKWSARHEARQQLLAIAAELRDNNTL